MYVHTHELSHKWNITDASLSSEVYPQLVTIMLVFMTHF